MKKSLEIIEQIRENSAKAEELESFVRSAKCSERTAPQIVKAAEEAETLRIENKILHDNARQAYFAEVMPIILEELNKYTGKPYGEKTREKINQAAKEKAGCAFYITPEYCTDTRPAKSTKESAAHSIPFCRAGLSTGTRTPIISGA